MIKKIIVGYSRTVSGNYQSWNFSFSLEEEVGELSVDEQSKKVAELTNYCRSIVEYQITSASEHDIELQMVLREKEQKYGKSIFQ